MASLIQPNFSKGEVSPSMYGRVDVPAYKAALRTARNTVVHPFGGISNRPGTVFIGPAKDHTYSPRLIPFQFSTTDAYMLEFGDFYMRVIKDNAHVTEATFAITAITEANPGVVTTSGSHGYTNGDEVFITGVVGMLPVNNRRFIVQGVTSTTFQLTTQETGANVDTTLFGAWTSGGTVGKIFEIVTLYSKDDIFELKFTQTANIMSIVHPTYVVQELTRSGDAAWSLTEPAFLPVQDHPTGNTLTVDTAGTEDDRYKVTAIADDGEESLSALNNVTETITGATVADPVVVTVTQSYVNGDEIEINGVVGMVELNGRRFLVSAATGTTIALQDTDGVDIDGTGFTAYDSAGTSNLTFVRTALGAVTRDNTIGWTAVVGANKYAVYLEDNGLFGLIGETELTTFKDANIAADTVFTPPKYIEAFFFVDDLPGAVGFWEQRRVFGGANSTPDTLDYSKTGLLSNFTFNVPRVDDDAITATLTSRQVNQVRHIVPHKSLMVFTSGSEWQIDSGPDSSFTATTLTQKEQSVWGSSHRQPIVIDENILFVQTNNAIVRAAKFSFQSDSWNSFNVGLLSDHLLRNNTIIDWDLVQFPDPVIYMVRDDGQLVSLTFDERNDVFAWTTWDTDGKYEAVASLRTSLAAQDETGYFVVRRIINGNVVRYIEHTHTRTFEDVRDAFFVDSGLSLDNPVTITNVTSADPVVVTAPAHGFSEGDEVDIFDIVWTPVVDDVKNAPQPLLSDGAPQVNTRRFRVANIGQTNLMRWSEEIDNAVWSKTGLTFSVDDAANPLTGLVDAEKFIPDNLQASSWAWQVLPAAPDPLSTYNVSVYAKAAGFDDFMVNVFSTETSDMFARFDLTLGTILEQSSINSASIEDIGSGWYRCSINITFGASVTTPLFQTIRMGSGTGDGTSGYHVWGAQTELSEGPGTYVKTEATQDLSGDDFELQQGGVDTDGSAYTAYIEGGTARRVVSTVHGFHHLVGEAVSALLDGNVDSTITVASNGSITLPVSSSRVHVGLGYVSDFETLNLEQGEDGETIQEKLKKIAKVTTRFERSRGLLFGPDTDNLKQMKQREFELMGDPTALLTGDHEQILTPDWNNDGVIFIRQINPLPVTILAIIPEFEVGD